MKVWVLNADIVGMFDNILHPYLLDKIEHFPRVDMIQKWLIAGLIYEEVWYAIEAGTLQGSSISVRLANITLHGL